MKEQGKNIILHELLNVLFHINSPILDPCLNFLLHVCLFHWKYDFGGGSKVWVTWRNEKLEEITEPCSSSLSRSPSEHILAAASFAAPAACAFISCSRFQTFGKSFLTFL
jgi:hypothetical protein